MSGTGTETIIKPKLDLKEPNLYKVIYINDNKTSMQFVIDSLEDHFYYGTTSAEQIATQVHNEGSAVVAVLPYEVAEQKGIEVTIEARSNGYPLQIKIEEDA